jgi:hypothetical protein
MHVWCDAYGLTGQRGLLGEIKHQVRLTLRRRRGGRDRGAAAWRQAQLQWIEQHQQQLGA